MECLNRLSIQELQEIQKCVETAMEQKNDGRVQEARNNILAYLREAFTDIEIVDFLKLLWLEEVYKLDPQSASDFLTSQAERYVSELSSKRTAWHQLDEDFPVMLNKLVGYLTSRHDEVIAKDEAYLLWLMNNGGQKLSKISGADLSQVMLEAISRAEQIASAYERKNKAELEIQLKNLSDWFEAQTEIPLINTIFTVVAIRNKPKKNIPQVTNRAPKINVLMPMIAQRN